MDENTLMKITYDALRMACKFMRDNPPGDLDMYREYPGLMACLAGGGKRDPEGKEYVNYFLNQAMKKMGM